MVWGEINLTFALFELPLNDTWPKVYPEHATYYSPAEARSGPVAFEFEAAQRCDRSIYPI